MSFKPEVIADSSGEWTGNQLRFNTEKEAKTYVADLMLRWTLVTDTRVVESSEPVNVRLDFAGHGFALAFLDESNAQPE
jgi:hypothetical protein